MAAPPFQLPGRFPGLAKYQGLGRLCRPGTRTLGSGDGSKTGRRRRGPALWGTPPGPGAGPYRTSPWRPIRVRVADNRIRDRTTPAPASNWGGPAESLIRTPVPMVPGQSSFAAAMWLAPVRDQPRTRGGLEWWTARGRADSRAKDSIQNRCCGCGALITSRAGERRKTPRESWPMPCVRRVSRQLQCRRGRMPERTDREWYTFGLQRQRCAKWRIWHGTSRPGEGPADLCRGAVCRVVGTSPAGEALGGSCHGARDRGPYARPRIGLAPRLPAVPDLGPRA